MNVTIIPSKLKGTVKIPASKSMAHRMLIAAALGSGGSFISNVTDSADINATSSVLSAFGADINSTLDCYRIKGIFSDDNDYEDTGAPADCCESGSTLRFLIPVAAALGRKTVFTGRGKLPERPITPYLRELPKHGVTFGYNGTMPFTVSGKLDAGVYELEGDISSQFITGLLMALPLCEGDSEIRLISVLQSKPYVDLTLEVLKMSGIKVKESLENGLYTYRVPGSQKYGRLSAEVEGDYSQAAFFCVANALGCSVKMKGLKEDSAQGDKAITEIVRRFEADRSPFTIDVADIPDLVPILTVLGCFTDGVSRIVNAARLRIKESDRLEAISAALNAIGGHVEADADSLAIYPVKGFTGGTVDPRNDHRIAMAAAIASVRSSAPVTITGAEAVNKSYPSFFDDLSELGAEVRYK